MQPASYRFNVLHFVNTCQQQTDVIVTVFEFFLSETTGFAENCMQTKLMLITVIY